MAIRQILQLGNPVLRRVSKKVDKIDEPTLNLIQDMKDTLYSTTGIGLAAPQIGVLKKIILIDLREGDGPIILINPVIVAKVGQEESVEGCLSYVGHEGKLVRPKKVTVTGLNVKGEKVEYTADGLLAKAFCHEIDHLEGIMYVDRAKKVYKLEEE
ncbi:peptide deformylase [Clostridium omnivorum]|uniref:Peptide deformylase n=1 Tax=Clostridium omnivorum TaxID=1604902 RepID=A0ABQ5NA54_9CLOT|nr:peptide deformylase [Clostridium sp. E14]GLC32142.1 peptide deformylase [Clostridium sp. E14]